jgi:hypothetical protein
VSLHNISIKCITKHFFHMIFDLSLGLFSTCVVAGLLSCCLSGTKSNAPIEAPRIKSALMGFNPGLGTDPEKWGQVAGVAG